VVQTVDTATPTIVVPESADVPTESGVEDETESEIEGEEDESTVVSEIEARTEDEAGIPLGFSKLIVTNSFHYTMRFTLDQQYRTTEGGSEYDLEPGDTISFIIYPGVVRFSGSTPWNGGLAGNTEVYIAYPV